MNKIIVAVGGMLCVFGAYASYGQKTPDATENDITTSQAYVDTASSNTQNTIPAKSGDKIVTYTGTKGTIGERDIVTTIGVGDGLTTVGTVKTRLNNKQDKTIALPSTNVVTYSGAMGIATTTPIYDDTVNTFQNGLVRAETLNEAVAEGVRKSLIGVGPDGVTPSATPMFWRVNSNFADVLPTTANLPANVAGTSICYKKHSGQDNIQNNCSNDLYDAMLAGEWGVVFPYGEVKGVSVCSDIAPNETDSNGKGIYGSVSTNQSGLTNAYNTWVSNGRQTTVAGRHCYCKLVSPAVATPSWVFINSYGQNAYCAGGCANGCSGDTRMDLRLRRAVFSAAAVQ